MTASRRRKHHGVGAHLSRVALVLRWTVRVALILLIVDLFYLMITWPDWKRLAAGPVPKSSFMHDYELRRTHDKQLPPLRWRPVSLAVVPKHLVRAVILAEDARFFDHGGFDLIAFKDAMNYNLASGRWALGASTISQQTVKNLFLSASRNPLRKWHELVLTWGMEGKLSKRRILELYLNLAEFGPGVYGVEAAAQTYFNVSTAELSVAQAAELAATLPGPSRHNPAKRSPYFQKRSQKLLNLLVRYPGDAAESVMRDLAPPSSQDDAEADIPGLSGDRPEGR
jgi:monofunctional glycosyltransferase